MKFCESRIQLYYVIRDRILEHLIRNSYLDFENEYVLDLSLKGYSNVQF